MLKSYFGVFILLITFILYMDVCHAQSYEQSHTVKVVKIDSTKDYMLIYAVSNERKFKIVSRKVENDCKNVVAGAEFTVTLTSLNNSSPFPVFNPCDWNYGFPIGNDIRNEPEWECDIFLTDDIWGLCYTQKQEEKSQYKKWIESHPLDWTQVKGKRKENRKILDIP